MNKTFVNDDEEYSYFLKGVGSFINRNINSALGNVNSVLGTNLSALSQAQKDENKAQAFQQVQSDWGIDPKKVDDCDYLQLRLQQLSNQIQSELSKMPSKITRDRVINPMVSLMSAYKNNIARNKCVEKQQASEFKAQKEEALAEINKASASTPDLTKPIASPNKTTKYLTYGIGGVVVLLTLVIVMKAIKK